MGDQKVTIKKVSEKVDGLIQAFIDYQSSREKNATIIDNNFEILNSKLDTLKRRVSSIEDKINNLHSETSDNFEGVSKDFEEVKMELVKIRETTNYDEQFKNLQVVKGKRS